MILQTQPITEAPKCHWEKFRYHPVQSALWVNRSQHEEVVAGRGSGKTVLCRRKMILDMALSKPWNDPLYYYVLPTFQQAKRVAWYPFLRDIPENWYNPRTGVNRTDLSIELYNGSKLYIIGADKPARLEGNQADWVMVDEGSDQKPGLVENTIFPMLTRKNGKFTRLGIPKRTGIGRVEFREYYERGMRGEGGVKSFFWKTIETCTPKELELIEARRANMDPKNYEEQYEAKWLDIGGSVYYGFTEANLSHEAKYDPKLEIMVGCDFNVTPMSWTLGHFDNGKLYIFDEIHLEDTHTQATMDYLHAKYYTHMAGWRFFGDASGRARKTSATRSDYAIIKNDSRFGQKKVHFPPRNPHVRDRVASVNRAFQNAAGEISCYINPKCAKLIRDLNSMSYIENTMELEDYSGTQIGHMSDAFGYKVHWLMPIRVEYTSIPAVWSTAS